MFSVSKTESSIISLVVILFTSSGFAQEDDNFFLEEIVVTAQKREQSIVDVPIAMTALTADQIEKTRAKTIKELQGLVPNFSFETVNGFSNISIRGVGGGGRNIGFDSRSGLYIDGVYIGQASALSQPLFGIERVEVLRGPQGHLFGRNTVSGAVSLTTQGPSDEAGGSVRAVMGNEDTYEGYLTLEGPLGEKVLGKISGAYETRGGFGINAFSGEDIDDLERSSFRGQLSFLTTDKLTIDVFGDYSETNSQAPVGEAQTTGMFSFGTTYPAPPRVVDTNIQGVDDRVVGGGSVTINYNADSGHTFTSISAYRYAQQDRENDTDYSPADSLNIVFDDDSGQISQEFRWISPDDQRVRYVLGLYYLYEDAGTNRVAHLGTTIGGPLDITIDSSVETTSYAAFAAVDVDISNNLTLNLGGRYTTESKNLDYSMANGFVLGLAGSNPFNPLVTVTDDISDDAFTPMIGLTMAVNDDVNIYAKYTYDGFKSGGFNAEFISDAAIAARLEFDPESVNSFEVGMKGTVANGRLSFDAAVFFADYSDFQILQFVEVGVGLTDIQLRNAADVETKGIEASATYFATENLRLGANVGFLDAKFKSFPDAAGVGIDFDGNELPNAPEFTAAVTVDYTRNIPSLKGNLDVYFEYSYRGESFSLANNDPVNAYVPSRNLVNARISYHPDNSNWNASLWSRNLFDEDYIDFRVRDFLGNEVLHRGSPLTWGVEVGFYF